MPQTNPDQQRPSLVISRDEAKRRIAEQIDKPKTVVPNASVNENDEARRWYDFTAELLRQICTTDELTDEVTGRSSISVGGGDISTGHYLKSLVSIYERLALYPVQSSVSSMYKGAEPVDIIEPLIRRFHIVVRQMRQRHDNRSTLGINDEYDVQDLFHALLRIHFDDVRAKEWTPSYAGGSSRMDFLIKSEEIAIEVKKTRARLGAKEVGEQLSVDILRYRSHPDCRNLLCFIYVPEERILNPRGLENDLNQSIGEMKVRVYITQR